MNNDYIQNLRYKLQKRFRRLNSVRSNMFHARLKQFWCFLHEQYLFHDILQNIQHQEQESIRNKVNDMLCDMSSPQPLTINTEKEGVIASYLVIKYCVEKGDDHSEIIIGDKYRLGKGWNDSNSVEAFLDNFVEPLYEYIDEHLDDSGFILALLTKYKHKAEWFHRQRLYKCSEDTKRGEKLLALDLYEYLYDQGIEFSIEPTSASGEVDLIAAQTSPEPLIADAKIFNVQKDKNTTYIIKGFHQIYRYTLDFNQPIGYLVIFKTGKDDIKFTFANESQSTPFVKHNNKTIFFLVIDIFEYEQTASKRGKLKSYEITEDMLWEKVGDELQKS